MASHLKEILNDTENSRASYSDLCKICLRNTSQYTCPRCNTPYCSVSCYKSEVHLDCSESFYQEWVENDLKSNRVTLEGQKRMLEILKVMHQDENELDSDDEPPPPDLADRLSGVDLNDANQVWNKLSVSEQAAFKELVATGKVADIIPPWEPWWTKRYDDPLVTPVDSDIFSDFEIYKKKCPPVNENIPSLTQICKTQPSSLIIFDLLNILGGYALTMRHFNGDYLDMSEEAMSFLFNISQSLGSAQKFSSSEMALEAVGLQALIDQSLETGEDEIEVMKDDVQCILNGPTSKDKTYYILAVLTDIYNLFSLRTKKKHSVHKGQFYQNFPSPLDIKLIDKQTCKVCLKRISFMQSWVKACDDSSFSVLYSSH